MDRILKILKKENAPRASSAPALELNTIIFKHVYGYMQQISGERLQDHWSSGLSYFLVIFTISVAWKNNQMIASYKPYKAYQAFMRLNAVLRKL